MLGLFMACYPRELVWNPASFSFTIWGQTLISLEFLAATNLGRGDMYREREREQEEEAEGERVFLSQAPSLVYPSSALAQLTKSS